MRLIDGDMLLEQLKTLRDNWDTKNATHRAVRGAFVDCILRTKEAPTIDAAPVKHGRWIIDGAYQTCALCGAKDYGCVPPYCWNCGAKMDGVDE